jgi:hypothetical protein
MKFGIKCDFHIHSQFSDGKLSIAEIVDLYGQNGYGAIAITDHLCEQNNFIGQVSHSIMNYSLSNRTFIHYMAEIEIQAARAWSQYRMRVLPGYEITKNSFFNHRSAHILVIGTNKYISPDLSIETILKKAKKLKALTIAAHPFHTGEFEFQTFHLWSRREFYSPWIDAWEVNSRKKISSDVLSSGLPLIANSDFHHSIHFNSWKTKLFCEPDQESMFNCIREQKIDFFMDSLLPKTEGLHQSVPHSLSSSANSL